MLLNYIRNAVQKRWGEEYTLVTADGLEIEDSSGTQGRRNERSEKVRRVMRPL